MLNGYRLIVRNYKAEIVEFATKSIVTMPDDSKVYLIHTKYGDEYVSEKELSKDRESFEQECAEINKALEKAQRGGLDGAERSIYKPRPNRS